MNKWIAAAIKERKVTILLSVCIMFYGLYAYYYLPRQESPDTSSPAVQIVTVYHGASAKTVEEQVTKKIEDEIAALEGVDKINSISQDNVSIVFAMLNYNTDIEAQWDTLRENLADLQNEMPDGVGNFDVVTDLTSSSGIILALSSDVYDAQRLADFADQFKSKLANVEGVKRVQLEGVQEKRLNVTVKMAQIKALSIDLKDIYEIIRAQNIVIPPGSLETERGKINVSVPKTVNSLADLENLVVSVSEITGSVVRLKDVATVQFEMDEGDLYFLQEGRPSVLLTAEFAANQNVVLIGKEVRRVIDTLKDQYPEALLIDEVLFLPEDVEASVNGFIMNLLQGVLFVILVIFIGMGLRNAVVVSIAIPLTLAITFITMSIMGTDLQQVSISALIISLGILVDNAIVISDAIQVHINQGMKAMKAAYLGAKEQAIPVLTSTLTTVAAFSPLMALPGAAGEFVASLPFVVIVALTASYGVAMLVTPALASLNLRPRSEAKDVLSGISRFYTHLLENNLKRPLMSVLLVVVMVLGAGYLFKTVDIRMFPYVDKDVLYVNITNEIVGDIQSTEALVIEAERILRAQPETLSLTSAIGGGLPRFYMTADFVMPSENNGQIFMGFDLSKGGRFKTRSELLYYLQDEFDRQLVGGYGTVNLLEVNMPGSTIEVRVTGDHMGDLENVSQAVFNYLLDRPETLNVQVKEPSYRYGYQLDIDTSQAMQYGLTQYHIQYQLNLALTGSQASIFAKDENSYGIYVKADVASLADIENLSIKSPATGQKVLLKQVAGVSLKSERDEIKRFNRQPIITVTADVRPQYGSGSVQAAVETFVEDLDTSFVDVAYGGDQETMDTYLSGLYVAAAFALVVIYIILLIQFNSLIQPFVILSTVPLALIGVVLALVLTGTNFTFTVGLGAASLIGIVVNNGILLIEYINRARELGMSVHEACRDSVGKRMRPILLSMVTTIFGLVPLVFADSSFFTPMAIALIGGLLVATVMTLTIVPTIYALLSHFESHINLTLDLDHE